MEKFSTWRDKGTGISPFMPTEIPKTPLNKFVVDPILLAVKTPVFYFLYLLAAVAPKPAIKAILSFLFGIEDVDVLVEGVRRTKIDEINRNRPAIDQVVISNWVSPLDVFVIFFLSNVASLSQIAVVIPRKGALYHVSPWQSVSLFFGGEVEAIGEKISSLAALKGKLVVFFAEGTASNNRAVLPLVDIPLTFYSTPGFNYKTVVLKVYPNSLTLPIPYLSKSQYLTRLLTHLGKGYIKVKIVPVEKASATGLKAIFSDNGLSTVELGLDQKAEFGKYYQSYALSNFTK